MDAAPYARYLRLRHADQTRNVHVTFFVRGFPSLQIGHMPIIRLSHTCRQDIYTFHAIEAHAAALQNRGMKNGRRNYLKEYREKRDWSQAKLAEMITDLAELKGLGKKRMPRSQESVARMESGLHAPSQLTMDLLCEIFEKSERELKNVNPFEANSAAQKSDHDSLRNNTNNNHNAIRAIEQSLKMDALSLGPLHGEWAPTPGGVPMRSIEIEAGNLPRNEKLFTLDFEDDILGIGFPNGTLVGSFTDESDIVGGDTVLILQSRNSETKHIICKAFEVIEGRQYVDRGGAPLDIGIKSRVIGRVLEYRLQPE